MLFDLYSYLADSKSTPQIRDAANVPKGVAMTTQTSRFHRTIASVRRVLDELDRGMKASFRF